MLLATPYLPFPIGIAPHNRSPLRLAIDALSTSICSVDRRPILSALCTIRLNSVHNLVAPKRQSLTVAVTLVHQRCRCHEASKTSYTWSLTIFPIRSSTAVSALQMPIPVGDWNPPSWKRCHRDFACGSFCQENQLIECRFVLVADHGLL